jgi:hypothetical protein
MCRASSSGTVAVGISASGSWPIGIDLTGETGPVQRFRQLISTMAAVVSAT